MRVKRNTSMRGGKIRLTPTTFKIGTGAIDLEENNIAFTAGPEMVVQTINEPSVRLGKYNIKKPPRGKKIGEKSPRMITDFTGRELEDMEEDDVKGSGAYLAGAPRQFGSGAMLAGGGHCGHCGSGAMLAGGGAKRLPAYIGEMVIPQVAKHLNLPISKVWVRKAIRIVRKAIRDGVGSSRMSQHVADMILKDMMKGRGADKEAKKMLCSGLKKIIDKCGKHDEMSGSGIWDSLKGFFKKVGSAAKTAGKWAWDNREDIAKTAGTIASVASTIAPLL